MRKYDLILTDMERRMNEGAYRPGQKLPSVRDAAVSYGCSVSTITRAYSELERRHLIYSIPQSGYYVVGKPEQPLDRQSAKIDFTSASPDLHAFPYIDFQHCMNKAIDIYKYELFTYGDALGLESLRHTLRSHLANDQVFARIDQILITSGVQQALTILAKLPFPNGKQTILVEQPSYNLYLRFLEEEGVPVAGISRTAAGIDLQELEQRFKHDGIKYFYTMLRYHNPLGTSYSEETRKAIAKLAGKYDVYIVEDDYMADLGEERGFEPIYAYDQTSHVVYLKSFSKMMFPGLRIGAAVLPDQLIQPFHRQKSYVDTSLLSQAALEIYIKNGMYDRHKHRISDIYAKRIQAFYEAVSDYNGDDLLEVPQGASGVYLHVKVPRTTNLDRLVTRLARRGIIMVHGGGYYLSDYLDREKFLRISISRTTPEQIAIGVNAIVEEIRGNKLDYGPRDRDLGT